VTAPKDTDWLSRALARAGVMPLGDAEVAVRQGRVRVGRRVVRQPLARLPPGEPVFVDGHLVDLSPRTLCLMFHKPRGVVTSTRDDDAKGTVFERLYAVMPYELRTYNWHAVGRLDRDTTGLLLFTNDERLVAHATSPDTHLERRYLAQVQGTATDDKLAPLRAGVRLDDGLARPAQARVREDGQVELTITEGRFHQVKRMLAAVGLPVRRLHREALGTLELDVPEGAYRALGEVEVREKLGYAPR
jgi:pseudouridine synthase